MIKRTALAMLLLAGCGPYKVEVEPNPIVVEHRINIADLQKYFKILCQNELTNPTAQELEDCIDEKIAEFIDIIGS